MATEAEIDALLALYSMHREKVEGMSGVYWLVFLDSDPSIPIHAWDFSRPIEGYIKVLAVGESSIEDRPWPLIPK